MYNAYQREFLAVPFPFFGVNRPLHTFPVHPFSFINDSKCLSMIYLPPVKNKKIRLKLLTFENGKRGYDRQTVEDIDNIWLA